MRTVHRARSAPFVPQSTCGRFSLKLRARASVRRRKDGMRALSRWFLRTDGFMDVGGGGTVAPSRLPLVVFHSCVEELTWRSGRMVGLSVSRLSLCTPARPPLCGCLCFRLIRLHFVLSLIQMSGDVSYVRDLRTMSCTGATIARLCRYTCTPADNAMRLHLFVGVHGSPRSPRVWLPAGAAFPTRSNAKSRRVLVLYVRLANSVQ